MSVVSCSNSPRTTSKAGESSNATVVLLLGVLQVPTIVVVKLYETQRIKVIEGFKISRKGNSNQERDMWGTKIVSSGGQVNINGKCLKYPRYFSK